MDEMRYTYKNHFDAILICSTHLNQFIILQMGKRTRIGLALGGGSARGLAHIFALEVFDELGIRPEAISGTSAGAIIGAIYASGVSARRIRNYIDSYFDLKNNDKLQHLDGKKLMRIVKLLDPDFSGTGLIKGKGISHFLYDMMDVEDFRDLKIPLTVIAADFWNSSEVIIRDGPLIPAVKASMSVPGVFAPVYHMNRLMVDGACVNPVPWDRLEDCDVRIGINVLGRPFPKNYNRKRSPKAAKMVLGSFEMMQRSILNLKLHYNPPDLLLSPPLENLGIFYFRSVNSIYNQCELMVEELRDFLACFVK